MASTPRSPMLKEKHKHVASTSLSLLFIEEGVDGMVSTILSRLLAKMGKGCGLYSPISYI